MGVEPRGGRPGDERQGAGGVPVGERRGQLHQLNDIVVGAAGGNLIESRKGVASRPPTPSNGTFDGLVGELEAGGFPNRAQETGQDLGAEEMEFVVLGPAADGGQHLLHVGGGQHEHHVGRRLFQRLEQRVGGGRRQHVDLVDDVDLPPARGAERRMGHEVTHGVHPVVRSGVELVDVKRTAPGDLHTGVAHPARFSVHGIGAVERLGQDAGRRRLARAPWAAEEVGVADVLGAHGVAKSQADVILAEDVPEALGPEAAVERLIRRCLVDGAGGHGRSLPATVRSHDSRKPVFGATARLATAHGRYPLRAAAFRP